MSLSSKILMLHARICMYSIGWNKLEYGIIFTYWQGSVSFLRLPKRFCFWIPFFVGNSVICLCNTFSLSAIKQIKLLVFFQNTICFTYLFVELMEGIVAHRHLPLLIRIDCFTFENVHLYQFKQRGWVWDQIKALSREVSTEMLLKSWRDILLADWVRHKKTYFYSICLKSGAQNFCNFIWFQNAI